MAGPPEDDWFPETEATPSPTNRLEPAEDWLTEPARPQRPTSDLWAAADRRILVPAAIVVMLLISVLAAFGVFNSSPRIAAPTTSASTPTAPQTSSQQTTTTAPKIVPPTMTLAPGDIGPEVEVLQRELETLGYRVGVIDGIYGPSTTKAVTAFQRAHGLTADGIVGPKTLQALAP